MHPNVKARILNALFRGDALTLPTMWFVGLHSTSLTTAALPTTVTEVPRSNGYSRMGVTTGNWSTATSALPVKNSTGIQFPDPNPAGWGGVSAVALYDSSVTSGGSASTCWFFQNLASSVTVSASNPVRFSSAQLTIFLE